MKHFSSAWNDRSPTRSITSTPYAVCHCVPPGSLHVLGGIWDTFTEPYLTESDIKLFVWDIQPVHLVRWNLLICFPCFWNLEFLDITFEDLLRFEHRTSLFSCFCMSMATPNSSGNMQKHGYLGCFHAASTRENISGVCVIRPDFELNYLRIAVSHLNL